jgi:beta-N-acetylhexosaminidase
MATAKHFPGHGDTAIDSHRGLPVIDADRARLDRVELVPYRAAIAAGVGSVMASYIGLPRIDPTVISPLSRERATRASEPVQGGEIVTENATLPAALSPVIIGGLLRGDLHFDGLIVTDALDMGGLTIYFKQDEAAVRAVEAGADMLIKPSDPDAAIRGLRQAVQAGRISLKRIEDSARRILAAKYDLGLVRQRLTPIEQIDRLLSDPDVVAFANEVAEQAITLIRNDAGLLPISLKPDGKIFNLAITNGDDRLVIATPFSEEMRRRGRRIETLVLDARSSEEEIRQALRLAQEAGLVIVSLYGRVRSGESRSVGIPESSARALAELIKRDVPLVGISFGNPYLLQSFPRLQTYLVAYGDMPSLQEAAARALLGQANITGRLPITLPRLYPRGTGLQLKASAQKTRVNHAP